MKKINSLACLNHFSFEICFPKESLCGTRKKYCVTSSEIGTRSRFYPRWGISALRSDMLNNDNDKKTALHTRFSSVAETRDRALSFFLGKWNS